MLNPEQAQATLKTCQVANWKERRRQDIARLPVALRIIAEQLSDHSAYHHDEARQRLYQTALNKLEALPSSDRQRLFNVLFPQLGAYVEAGWQLRHQLPYQIGYHHRAFRAPHTPSITQAIRANWLTDLLLVTAGYEQDITWYATWAAYLPYSYTDALGILLAAAIDVGDDAGQQVFNILVASANGEHEIGAMGRHVTRALLAASRPDGWDYVERLLLAAQRQEGLRQVVLETIDETHPTAFRRMLHLILDHNLVRFSSVVRAADVWFGLQWEAATPRAITETIEAALCFLEDPAARSAAIKDGDASSAFFALWAMAFDDAMAAIEPAAQLLTDANVERRFIGTHLLAELDLTDAHQALLAALDDPDRRVVARAIQSLSRSAYRLNNTDLFERFEQLLPRLPKEQTLPPLVWPWLSLTMTQASVAGALLGCLGTRSPKRLIPYLSQMDVMARSGAVLLLAKIADHESDVLDTLFQLVGDSSPLVREQALKAIERRTIAVDEAQRLEQLLTRSAHDLRRGVLSALLKQGDWAVLDSADRLIAGKPAQRLAGWELLREMIATERLVDESRARASQYQAAARSLSANEQKLIDAIWASQTDAPTLDNALGLMQPDRRTVPNLPSMKGTTFVTSETLEALRALGRLVHSQRATLIAIETWEGPREELLGNVRWGFPQPKTSVPVEEDVIRLPLRDLWEAWYAEYDTDDLLLARAFGALDQQYRFGPVEDGWRKALCQRLYGEARELELPYCEISAAVVSWLARLHPPAGAVDFLLDAVETTLALLPLDELQREFQRRDSFHADWRYSKVMGWLKVTRFYRTLCPASWTCAHQARLWNLVRWMDEPLIEVSQAGLVARVVQAISRVTHESPEEAHPPLAPISIPRRRPNFDEVLMAYHCGAATEDDLIDHLLGPRGNQFGYVGSGFDSLHALSSRRPREPYADDPIVRTLVDRCRERILEVELQRGDLPTAASSAAIQLRSMTGVRHLVQLLQALGREKFIRGYIFNSQSKAAVFSHLIRVTVPAEGDTPDLFVAQMTEAKITPRRLIEVALYAPQWAGYVERALDWPGLAEGVWWFHAHTKDIQWRVDVEIRDLWAAQVSERTPLSGQDLLEGAVDVAWFRRAHQALGAEHWADLHAAAVYASGGNGHTRAKLFAEAMLDQIEPAALLQRIRRNRHQDSVRALGLLPLRENRDVDLLERYEVIQEFIRGSRQFGSQRQASEKLAARVALQNLARMAGYPDPVRLEWAMEARAIADLAAGPLIVTMDTVTIRLAIDTQGQPDLSINKAGKALKAIPAAMKKDARVVELLDRKKHLERQASRMRQSLEEAMCRGDTFTGAELHRLFEHPILAPMLAQLIFVGDGLIGYPSKQGQALVSHVGVISPVHVSTVLRVAHPHDLLASGEWHLWQRECFLNERIQPFKQVFRELYPLTAMERNDRTISRRYAGHQVNPRQAAALLQTRNWVLHPEEGARRTFHCDNLSAWLITRGNTFTPADVEGWTLEGVRFTRRGEWQPIDLADVPPCVFSETMRDVDLIVSVAHQGGVDPEASASTVEMRTALIRETCQLLQIANVEVQKSHALIEGKLGSYSVQLGSGVVHRQPGGALCIVPVHAQHRGRLFLPFADDDPKTAEVLSKIVLLARDDEIKDPTILEQILFAR